ncbi:MAG: hypothetical protein KatS3mg105_0214 [Gemmatales bacterium]|nr:MAG: hypothetical protein KatS3mg105_0214 [Gemmatales bacterium]
MPRQIRKCSRGILLVLPLLVGTGCSIQLTCTNPFARCNGGCQPGISGEPVLPNPPPPAQGPPPHEQISLMSQQLAASQDRARIERAHLQQLHNKVEDREQVLGLAESEIIAAKNEITEAREKILRMQKETEALKKRLERAEKDNQATMESMIRLLERMLQSGNMPRQP